MTKEFIRAAGIRCLRTFCQGLLGYIGAASIISQVNWVEAFSAAALAAIMSVLTSIATGLPEA